MRRTGSVWLWLSLVGLAGCEYYAQPNRPLPDSFSVVTLSGATVDRERLKGTPTVLALWVPGCHLCARELPELDAIRRELEPKGVRFLAVSLLAEEGPVVEAAGRLDVGMKLALAKGELLGPLGVSAVPSTVFVDADGVIVAAASGPRSPDSLAKRARALLSP